MSYRHKEKRRWGDGGNQNLIIYFGHNKQKETLKQHKEGMNIWKKGTQKEIFLVKTREQMITHSTEELFYIDVAVYEDFIAAAAGIPERWKCTHCQRESFLCHTRVSSVRTLCGWPFLNHSNFVDQKIIICFHTDQ